MEQVSSIGLPKSLATSSRKNPLGEGQVALAASTRTFVQAPNLDQDPLFQAQVAELGKHRLHSAYAVPLLVGDRLIGVIQAFCQRERPLSGAEYKLVYSSGQAAAAEIDQIIKASLHPTRVLLEQLKHGTPRDELHGLLRPEVLDSWERCLKWFNHAGSRTQAIARSPLQCSSRQLVEIQENSAGFLKAARQHLINLFDRVEELNYAVLLADANGWLIEVFGNPHHLRQLQQDGIWFGTNIAEQHLGNTAIGTVLATQKSVYFHSYEHFFFEHRHWSTAAAPIFTDSGSKLLGVCAFATLSEELNPYVFPLVQSASIAIANGVQLDELQQDAIRVHQSLLSHLDYHVIQLNVRHQVVSQRHPIPVFEPVQREMIRITQQGEYSHFEMCVLGRTYVVDVRDLWDAKGAHKGRLGLFRDVTQSKQIESRLQDTERLAVLTSLAAGIAHEIRNPLTTARGFLQLFSERLKSESDRRFLDLTITELDRIQQLVMDFMSLAKPDESHYAQTELTHLIRSTAQFLHPEATLHGVTLTVNVPDIEVYIWADEKKIKQILMNIVQNALHACTKQDRVSLQLTPMEDKVEVKVEDTGCGMNQEQLDKIFQPFFTTKATGTGLGLSVTKRIVEEHNGTISVESATGVGTTVCICLNRSRLESATG